MSRLAFSMPISHSNSGATWPSQPNSQRPPPPLLVPKPSHLKPSMPWPFQWFPRPTSEPVANSDEVVDLNLDKQEEEDMPTFEAPLFVPEKLKNDLADLNMLFWRVILGGESVPVVAPGASVVVRDDEKAKLAAALEAVRKVQALQDELSDATGEYEDYFVLLLGLKVELQQLLNEAEIKQELGAQTLQGDDMTNAPDKKWRPYGSSGYLPERLQKAKKSTTVSPKSLREIGKNFQARELEELEEEVERLHSVVQVSEAKMMVAVEEAEVLLTQANMLVIPNKAEGVAVKDSKNFPLGPKDQLVAAQQAVKTVRLTQDALLHAKEDIYRQDVFIAVAQEAVLELESAPATEGGEDRKQKDLEAARHRLAELMNEKALSTRVLKEKQMEIHIFVEEAEVQLARANLLLFGATNWWSALEENVEEEPQIETTSTMPPRRGYYQVGDMFE